MNSILLVSPVDASSEFLVQELRNRGRKVTQVTSIEDINDRLSIPPQVILRISVSREWIEQTRSQTPRIQFFVIQSSKEDDHENHYLNLGIPVFRPLDYPLLLELLDFSWISSRLFQEIQTGQVQTNPSRKHLSSSTTQIRNTTVVRESINRS